MIQITKDQAAEGFWLGCCSDYYIKPELFDSLEYWFAVKCGFINDPVKELQDKVCSIISQIPTPISIPVSGGVDSTFMLLMARKCFETKDLRAVTVFSQNKTEEYERAVDLCNETDIHLSAVMVLPRQLREMISAIDSHSYRNWFFNSSLVPTYSAIKRGAEVGASVLTGDGGDELFCGYDRFLAANIVERVPKAIRKALIHLMPSPKRERRRKLLELLDRGYEGTIRIWTKEEVEQLLGKYPRGTIFEGYQTSISAISSLKKLEKYMLLETATLLYGREVAKVETAARMAGDAKVVSPFLEPEVMKFCCALPFEFKYKRFTRKWLLRKMIEKEVEYRPSRKKTGFSIPIGQWYGLPEMHELIESYIFERQDPYLNQKFIDQIWKEHFNGFDNTERLWSILMWRLLTERGILKIEDPTNHNTP